jgi:hypothetical protein
MTPATVLAADPDEVVENGSFENGFTGWTTEETAGVWLYPWQVTGAGYGGDSGMATTSPQDGDFVAWNSFTGYGPLLEFRLWQDVTIPTGVATLSWMDRIQKLLPLGSDPYTYEVQIRDPDTNNLLFSVYSYTINPSNAPQDTGWQSHSEVLPDFDVSTVRLYFVEYVANNTVGPGQFEIDAVSLLVDPGETNQPPIADAGPDRIVETNTAGGANVVLDGSDSSDTDNDPLTYIWTWDSETASGVNPTIFLPVGTTTVMLVVNDGMVDSESDTVDITVEPKQASARENKEDALAELNDIYPTDEEKVDKKIEKAIKHLDKSLDEKLWVDGIKLADKHGSKVFNEEKKTVKELMHLLKKDNTPEEVKNVCQSVIDKLIEADDLLAHAAYEEASFYTGNPKVDKELEKCDKEFEKAQKELDHTKKDGTPDPKYDKAIKHYKNAWKHAQKALGKAPEDDEKGD